MLSHEIEIIRLLHRERMEQLARAASRPPREEEAAEQRAPRRRARYALQLRRLHIRLREDL